MPVKDRDPLTGHKTTGHDWNGITELNTRVPRVIWAFIIVTHLYALVAWILLPSWPLIWTYTGGILGIDQQEQVDEQLLAAHAARSVWTDRIAAEPIAAIRADPGLMAYVNDTAPALFGDNCAVCHGANATGGPGFPNLVDDDWLWGGDPDAVMETLRVGINSSHPETRVAQMLAFGRDGILTRSDIRAVVAYVQSLSGGEAADEAEVAAGAQIFVDNCVACHGEDGTGITELGAPNLTDAQWIYGGDAASLFATVHDGRAGWMPAWEDRLSLADRKLLTVYLEELGEENR